MSAGPDDAAGAPAHSTRSGDPMGHPPALVAAESSAERSRLRATWIAFLVAVALYTPVPFVVVAAGEGATAPAPEFIRTAMSSAALGAGVASILARRWWTRSLCAALERDPSTPVSGGLWARLRAGCTVTWALSEAVALIGLVGAVLLREPTAGVPLAAAAAALLLYHRPSNWPIAAVERRARERV
jgi:hypothetical protein